jgi:radical SAM superfamily enzyme YgiQ (UPF0313 family)
MSNNQPKVLLINPPSEFKTPLLPLGLAYIAAFLKTKGIEVSVIDAWAEQMSFEKLKERLSQKQADIVGIYIVSPRYNEGKMTIELCRKVFPKAMIAAGGPHPSAVPDEMLKENHGLDICVIGEGEITMYELAENLKNKSDLSTIDGIAFRNKQNNEIVRTRPRDFIKNLDELPFPARELFPLEKYKTHPPYGRKNPYFSIMTIRGCPFQCAYCSKDVFKDNFRFASPKRVCDELEELISKYNAKEIHFYDDDFTINMERAGQICDEILKRGIKIRWSCTTRVDLVNEALLKKMKQAGCWMIAYGVESGNQKILDAINKGYTVEKVVESFALTKKIGILTLGYFMVGLPGETKETVQETLALAKKISPDFSSWGILVVYPGSRLFKFIKEGKYKGRLRTLDENGNLAGTFFGKGNYLLFEDNLTLKELREAVKRANIELYLRPKYIFQSLKNIRSFSDIVYYFNGGIAVIKAAIS